MAREKTPNKLITRMPPPQSSLNTSTEVADCCLLSNFLLPYRCGNHSSACAVDQGLSDIRPSWVVTISALRHMAPQGRREHGYQATGKQAHHFQKPTFSCMPTLSPVYKSSQTTPAPESGWRTPLFLCTASPVLKYKFNKIYLGIFLGFPLYFYLTEPKNPNTDNSYTDKSFF